MTCPAPQPCWWGRYLAGEFKTPQELVAAAYDEMGQSMRFDISKPSGSMIPPDTAVWDAPERLKAPAWFHNNSYLRQQERANWAWADKRLMVWAAIFQAMAQKRGIPLYVHTCLRDQREQDALVAAGNSKAKYPTSAHNIGEAVDIIHGTFHWEMSENEWKTLHVLGSLALDRLNTYLSSANKLTLEWGGNWKFYDPAHWEIKDYRQRVRKLQAIEPVHRTHTQVLAQAQDLLRNL